MRRLGGFVESLYAASEARNRDNIRELAAKAPPATLCDLGCDDGAWTMTLASALNCHRLFGIEIMADRATLARANGIETVVADLDQAFPFQDEQMELVHANQVIEHVANIDHFLSESRRILRPGGTLLISTENGSSWHNVVAAVMGWQIFSATNISRLQEGTGNPLALHRGRRPIASWTHRTILNFQGLRELVELHGLRVTDLRGAGYYPLPAGVGRIDPRHAHFITARAVKPV